MSAPVIWVGPESTRRQAIEVMTRKRLGAVVVCENGAARGIFTERDVINRASAEDRSWLDESISRHMTRDPITIDHAADWRDGLDRMTASTIRHLPVTANGVVVGMLSNRDMTVHRTEELERVIAARTAALEVQNVELARRDKRRSYDLDLAVTAMLVQRSVGGNLAEILDTVAAMMRERIRIRGEIQTLTSQQRLTGMVIGALPIGVGAMFLVVSPDYITVLFTHPAGRIMLGIALVLELVGVMVIRRIVAIEV